MTVSLPTQPIKGVWRGPWVDVPINEMHRLPTNGNGIELAQVDSVQEACFQYVDMLMENLRKRVGKRNLHVTKHPSGRLVVVGGHLFIEVTAEAQIPNIGS